LIGYPFVFGLLIVTQVNDECGVFAIWLAGKQLALSPGHIHFGSVVQGSVVHRTARVLNCSTGVARFTISRPELPLRCDDVTQVSVLYAPPASIACCQVPVLLLALH
jgi:hypothetical protein